MNAVKATHFSQLVVKFLKNGNSITRTFHNERELIKVKERDGVRRIKMIHDASRNSLTIAMTAALNRNIIKDTNNPKLRAIVISSNGPVFSAGHNLKEISDSNGRQVFYQFGQLMMDIIRCPVPVIAAINGPAAAAGCQLIAQCDLAVATPNSTFSTPGANYGVFCCTPGVALTRSVPKKLAAYMLFTGKSISAEEALKFGLISKLSTETNLDETVNEIIDDIKSKSRVVIQFGKIFFYNQMEMGLAKAYAKGARMMDFTLTLSDGIEGLKSFEEKRKPVWIHVPYN